MGEYDALNVANYIIDKCKKDGSPITNLQLQKILYFLQREYLQNNGYSLFFNEIQAWQFGPVVPDVYYKYCIFGAMPISRTYGNHQINDADMKAINPIIEKNMCRSPWELVEETHKSGGAWEIIYDNGKGNHNVIPEYLIQTKG